MEAEMDYAYAKHMQLMAKQRLLRVQYETLENLPVGIEALQDELDQLMQVVDDTKEGEEGEESASSTALVS
jgi:rhamnogalacturonyl hydrolase YesR